MSGKHYTYFEECYPRIDQRSDSTAYRWNMHCPYECFFEVLGATVHIGVRILCICLRTHRRTRSSVSLGTQLSYLSQSSSAKANIPKIEAASDAPPARLSTLLRIKRISPSSSDDVLLICVNGSSSTKDIEDAVIEKDGSWLYSPSGSSSSVSESPEKSGGWLRD